MNHLQSITLLIVLIISIPFLLLPISAALAIFMQERHISCNCHAHK